MIVLVDEENTNPRDGGAGRRFRNAPPVASNINGKEWDAAYSRGKSRDGSRSNTYDLDDARRGGGGGGGAPKEREVYPYHGVSRDNSSMVRPANRRNPSSGGYSHGSGQMVKHAAESASEFSFQLK